MLESKQKVLREVGLFKDSFDNVVVTKQDLSMTEDIADCLSANTLTSANTLDITMYFKSPKKDSVSPKQAKISDNSVNERNISVDEMDFFNDDFDDVLRNVDIHV